MKGTMAEYQKSVGWLGTLEAIHEVGDYAIVEYTANKDNQIRFHVFGTSHSCESLDAALLLAIGAAHLDINDAWRFETFALRMLKAEA